METLVNNIKYLIDLVKKAVLSAEN